MVVKRAFPFSSRLTPEAAPIGCSGFFSRAGRSVFSAHSLSAADGWRSSNVSRVGFSVMVREPLLPVFSADMNLRSWHACGVHAIMEAERSMIEDSEEAEQ